MADDYADLISEDGFSALPKSVQKTLRRIEGMPGDPAPPMLRREGFTDIRPEAYQKGRGVYTNEKTPGIVYKIGVDHNAWQNNIEKSIWEEQEHPSFEGRIPDKTLECLAPVFLSDDTGSDCHWLIMPNADMGVATMEQGISLMEKMLETEWVVTDHHRGNIGIWRDKALFVDYGQLKPERFLMDDWRDAMEAYDWSRAYKGGISINESLAHRLSTAISGAEGTKKVLEYTMDSTSEREEVQVTGYGMDTPDDGQEIATTLMLSVTKESEDSVEVFNRLVMVDTTEMRNKARELAESFNGRVDFGPSHFENPGDYIAAHLTLGEVAEMKDLTERVNKTVDLYEESIKRA